MARSFRLLLILSVVTTVMVGLPGASQARTVPATLAARSPIVAGVTTTPFPIDLLGVVVDLSGREHAHLDPQVRLRVAGRWTPWQHVGADDVEIPGQWASALVDGRRADAYQVRGLPPSSTAHATAMNLTDGPARRTGSVASSSAQALATCRSRADWGADESLRTSSRSFAAVQIQTLHHTATTNDALDDAATVRAVYRYHTVDRGFDDLGYHYLVGRDGTVYEGRWRGATSQSCLGDPDGDGVIGDGSDFAHGATGGLVTGAHVGGYNTGNVGVALLGTYSDVEPPQAAVDSATDVFAMNARRHGLDPQATVTYDNGTNRKATPAIGGHRDLVATDCPGGRLYARLPAIRDRVAQGLAGGGTTPEPTDTSVRITRLDLSGFGGKSGAKNLRVTSFAADSSGGPIVGAAVSVEVLDSRGRVVATSTDSTGADGTATAQPKVRSGCYGVRVSAVSAAGRTWDGASPTPTPSTFCTG